MEHPVSVTVQTECGHCGQPIHLTLDQDLRFKVAEHEASPLVFHPLVDWTTFDQPHILDGF